MKIGIIGQGFVGNAVYAKFRNFYDVLTYDIDKNKSNSTLDKIKVNCEVIFICVPTPMKSNGQCDISIVESIIDDFKNEKNKILVNKSTVIPGTTDFLNSKLKYSHVIFNPEFLTERNAVDDYNNQDRIILGGDRSATTLVKNIFSKVFPNSKIVKTGSSHAEMVKYFINAFLATKVSFSNEMYDLCSKLKLDYDKVVEYSIYDKRLGNSHFNVPGPDGDFGFGGHCFPKDLSAIISLTEKLRSVNNVLKSVQITNDNIRTDRDWERMKGRAVN